MSLDLPVGRRLHPDARLRPTLQRRGEPSFLQRRYRQETLLRYPGTKPLLKRVIYRF